MPQTAFQKKSETPQYGTQGLKTVVPIFQTYLTYSPTMSVCSSQIKLFTVHVYQYVFFHLSSSEKNQVSPEDH